MKCALCLVGLGIVFTVVGLVALMALKPGAYTDPKNPKGAKVKVTAGMITSMRIIVGVSLLFQCCWFGIVRGLWHSIANADTAGIDKYLKMYVAIYLLYLVGAWYGNKKKGPKANKYWLYGAVVDLLFNVWFVWYAHGVHGLIDNIKKHEEHWTYDCDKPYF